jgi:hypothetical protein
MIVSVCLMFSGIHRGILLPDHLTSSIGAPARLFRAQFSFQMSRLYSMMVRSEEKKPAFAIFTRLFWCHL